MNAKWKPCVHVCFGVLDGLGMFHTLLLLEIDEIGLETDM